MTDIFNNEWGNRYVSNKAEPKAFGEGFYGLWKELRKGTQKSPFGSYEAVVKHAKGE